MCNKCPAPQIGHQHNELYGNEAQFPHERWGEKDGNTPRGHVGNPKNSGLGISHKPT